MLNQKIRVGGVPEHFNLAWHLAIENKLFEKAGIQIEWHDIPGGTGAMCKEIENDSLDVVIGLTEGMIAQIANGLPAKILQFYVNSPLKWGIYTAYDTPLNDCSNLEGLKYAISRKFSGSHLMAMVNAQQLNHQIPDENFIVTGGIDGAIQALESNKAQLFMWEKFTTQPYVNNHRLKYIGACRTPWPCFVIAASDSFISQNATLLNHCLQLINQACFDLKYREQDAFEMIAWRYHLTLEQAKEWFIELEYAYHQKLDKQEFNRIFEALKHYGILDKIPDIENICFEIKPVLKAETYW